jgi:ATP synthase F1, epsilon subunit
MDKNRLHIKIVSPECILFEGEAERITMPGTLGEFEVLVNHAPIISSLSQGVVTCTGTETKEFNVSSGFVEVNDNNVTLCVETHN